MLPRGESSARGEHLRNEAPWGRGRTRYDTGVDLRRCRERPSVPDGVWGLFLLLFFIDLFLMLHHELTEEPQVKGMSLTLPLHLDAGTNRTVSDYIFGVVWGLFFFLITHFFVYWVKADTCFIYFCL